jgi:thymidylate kinase
MSASIVTPSMAPVESALAHRLLDSLHRDGIPYCVLGDPSRIAAAAPGDLDLMVEPAVLKQLPGRLSRFCREEGLDLVQCWQHEASCFSYVISWRDGGADRAFLMPDVCGDFLRGGRLFLSASELLPERRRVRATAGVAGAFFVPAPRHGFIYYLLKKVDKLSLEDRHAELLTGLWDEDSAGAAAQIERFWHGPDAELVSGAARTGRWEGVKTKLPELRAALRTGLPRTGRVAWGEARRRVRRVLYPTGMQVVLLGTDGSGKSSVIEALLRAGVYGFRRLHYTHFRPGWSNPENARPNPRPNPRPHGAPPRSRLTSTVKLLYYAADFVTSYVLDTRPRMVRSTLILFDRYYHDLLVDPRRYRYGGALTVARWIGSVVPRPHLVILLDAPADVVRARKQELPVPEIERQREAYRALAGRLPHGRVVDASQPLHQVVADVEDLIIRRAAELTRGRLGS